MKIVICFVVFAVSGACSADTDLHPFSDEFIDLVNSKQSSWKAGRNFDKNTPMSHVRGLLGVLDSPEVTLNMNVRKHIKDVEIPESFDSRENWPDCESIKVIRDQSSCGSCWAVAAASAISDRICIHSNGKKQVFVSDQDVLTCCDYCGFGCHGGFNNLAWYYWQRSGIVSGGLYNSSTGCKAYSMQPCQHHSNGTRPQCSDLHYRTPDCYTECDDPDLDYDSQRSWGQDPYLLKKKDAEQIQLEILKNGPVDAAFDVYSDFLSYKSGVYQKTAGDLEGGHAVRIIGWGVEKDLPYWLITNSWNEDWGDKGLFKIVRGRNECGIESIITTGLPKL